jgi:hypothetical protein
MDFRRTPNAERRTELSRNAIIFLILLFLPWKPAVAEEYKLELSEIDKKPYYLGGYVEFRPVFFGLNNNGALYQVKFYNQEKGRTLDEYNGRLQLEGSLEKGISRLFARTSTDLQYNYQGGTQKTTLYEGFLSVKPSSSLTLEAGKKTMKWGKGYAWNPVAFIDRPKDPNDPDLALEGYTVATADYTKSFEGPLKTFSITPVLVPVYDQVNEDFGDRYYLNFAGKLYFLFFDTDIDLVFMSGGSKTPRWGFDFSRNITPNLEVHGEWAWLENVKKTIVDANGRLSLSTNNEPSYVLGLRYLTPLDTTIIFEYYRNEEGLSLRETEAYFSFVHASYDLYRRTGNDGPINRAAGLAQGAYSRFTPMQDYLYLRMSQKEPFDILYFTPAITGIYNLDDQSFSVSPELVYTGLTNLELRLKGTFLYGVPLSEFGEKQNDYRIEFRVRYFF